MPCYFLLEGINLKTRKVVFREKFDDAENTNGVRLVKISPDKTRLVNLSIQDEKYRVVVFDTSAKKPVNNSKFPNLRLIFNYTYLYFSIFVQNMNYLTFIIYSFLLISTFCTNN